MKKTGLLIFIVFLYFPSILFANQDKMVLIKSGCFLMGTNGNSIYEDDDDNSREKPSHKVCLDSFYLDIYEVTQKKWDDVMKINRSVFRHPEQPITHIDWHEAKAYCKKIGKRLPTEAEWEYAARAGSQSRFPWGNKIDDNRMWYSGNSPREIPHVGKKTPNAWGLHDMMGNVWEWVEDWFSLNYYSKSPDKNPKGPTRQSFHVIRGGSWMIDDEYLRVTARHRGMSDPTESYWVGVRCAKSL